MKKLITTAALLLLVPLLTSAQEADHQYHGQGYVLFGEGVTNSATYHLGVGGEMLVSKGFGFGGELAFLSGERIGSADVSYHFGPSTKNRKVEPFVTGGYSFFSAPGNFPNTDFANGGNFGCGVSIWLKKQAALRLEIRDSIGGRILGIDYEPGYTVNDFPQHLVTFRIGVTFR